MIRQNQKAFNAIQRVIDFIGVVLMLYASYLVCRIFQNFDFILLFGWSSELVFFLLVSIALLHLFFFGIFHVYRKDRNTGFVLSVINIWKANLCSYLLLMLSSQFCSILLEVQVTLTVFLFANTVFQTSYRYLLRLTLQWFRKKGYNQKYILILGKNQGTESFIEKVRGNAKLGYEILGIMGGVDQTLPYLGEFSQLKSYLQTHVVDEVTFMQTERNRERLKESINICEEYGVKMTILPDVFSVFGNRAYITDFDGTPILNLRKIPLDHWWNYYQKRTLDIIISSICLILLSPIILLIALLIKATSNGPVIFHQERVGLNRRVFQMYKFRTMRVETEADLRMATKNDERCTTVGRYLRRYSLDELPQLWNTLKGDMSLVGPRPEIPYYVERFREIIPSYMMKHYVKPGMTGWAQIHGLRGNTSIPKRIRYDMEYIENWSLLLDLKILILTVVHGIFNKNAY